MLKDERHEVIDKRLEHTLCLIEKEKFKEALKLVVNIERYIIAINYLCI